jgi:AcrR family transcriptional regulator
VSDAKATLKSAALQTLATRGIAGTSARTIADTAGLSQGLIFYHYGSVNGLLEAASTEIAEQRAQAYRQRLATVTSLSELAELARQLHDEEQQLGNVAVMAQLLAGAHTHPELAPVARANYDLLANEVRDTLHRLLSDTALAAALPADHLAHAVSAAFIGIELLPPTDDADTSPELFETLGELARLVDSILDLGPTATAALRRRITRDQQRP